MTPTGNGILFVQPRHRVMADIMEQRGHVVYRHFEGPSEAVLAGPGNRASVLIASALPPLPHWFLDGLPHLRLIQSPAAGYDALDLAWCRDHGVAAAYVPGINAHEVVEHAIGLTLAAWRRILPNDRQVREGGWTAVRAIDWPSFYGSRVGIVGMGTIGRELARRLDVFGVDLAWWGPRSKADIVVRRTPNLLDLANWADIMIVTARGGEDSRHVIDRAVIEALGPGGLLVNVSRGSVVDEDSLIEALRSGTIGSAAIDAFEQEPTSAERWRDVPNVVLSPHTAGATRMSVRRLFEQAAQDIAAFLRGQPRRAAMLID